MAKQRAKPPTIHIYVSDEVYAAAEKFAEREDSTLSRLGRQALVGFLTARGAYSPKHIQSVKVGG